MRCTGNWIGIAGILGGALFASSLAANAQGCALIPSNTQSERLAAANLHPADLAALNRDLKAIRDAADALAANGQEAACTTLADALAAIVADPTAAEDAARAVFAAATPLDGPETIAVGDLLGIDLYGLSGRPIGGIEDVWLGGAAAESLVLVSLSGVLARDGRYMAAPLAAIRVTVDGRYYLGLTTNDIAAAPRLADRNTPPTAEWRQTNQSFYATRLASVAGAPTAASAASPPVVR